MQITCISISNVLSFGYHAHIEDAAELRLDTGLNILIGQNGAGKSTVLEVINFLCKRVMFRHWTVNDAAFDERDRLPAHQRNSIVSGDTSLSIGPFRLEPHWDHATQAQTIRVQLSLDDIDRRNIALLHTTRRIFCHWLNGSAARVPTTWVPRTFRCLPRSSN
jgi:energy-coupling factor transporter ATP-binding protein EcfA2